MNLPDQNLLLQGFGRQATDEKIGELLELELKTISNEECYADLTSQKNHRGFNPGNSTRVRNSLYEGVTDQILCTKLTCNLEENNTELSAKCVSFSILNFWMISRVLLGCKIVKYIGCRTAQNDCFHMQFNLH